MRISLTMIVRNESANLRTCLDLVRDLPLEIVVVDTGSTDDTRAIATELGARVIDFPWRDDFSAARNAGIEHATGDWIFILDADDRVVPSEKAKLANLFVSLGEENVGYVMGHVCLASDRSVSAEVNQVRLFPRRSDIRWSYRVHEQVVPDVEKAGGAFVDTGIRIVHLGFRNGETVATKLERNLRLAELDCADRPLDPLPMMYRGAILAELSRPLEAIVSLSMALPLLDETSDLGRGGAVMLARALTDENRTEDALEVARRAAAVNPHDVVIACTLAELLIARRDVGEAGAILAGVIDDRRELMAPVIRARALLGEVYLTLGLWDAALEIATSLTSTRPAFGRAWLLLADALFAGNRHCDVEGVRDKLRTAPNGGSGAALIDAALALRDGREVDLSNGDSELFPAFRDRLNRGSVDAIPFVSCLFWPWAPRIEQARKPLPADSEHSRGFRFVTSSGHQRL